MGPAGFIAVLAGWITTEVGRQPYVVYGIMRTVEAASPIAAPAVAGSLLAFVLVYVTIFGAGTYYILRLMARPPEAGDDLDDLGPTRSAGDHAGPERAAPAGPCGGVGHGPVLTLEFVWAGLIAFAVLAYVVLDGFDLGHRHHVSRSCATRASATR